jgi:hypothetical protein
VSTHSSLQISIESSNLDFSISVKGALNALGSRLANVTRAFQPDTVVKTLYLNDVFGGNLNVITNFDFCTQVKVSLSIT